MKNLDTLLLEVDVDVIIYALVDEKGKRFFGGKLKDAKDNSCGEATDSQIKQIAWFVAEQLQRKALGDNARQFAVFFPDDNVASTNVHGQLHLCEGLTRLERRTFWKHFAAKFKKLGVHDLHPGCHTEVID